MTENIAFVGLGNMGRAIARNLLAAGHHLRVWNRTPGKDKELGEAGAERASSAADAVVPRGILVTMVADDKAVEEVVGSPGLLERLGNGVHLSMSTIGPETSRRLLKRHEAAGSSYVAAPVFGRPEAAEARKLWVCVSGPAKPAARVRPLLDAIGQGVFEFGEDPGAANVVKLCGNFLIVAAMEAMAEAWTLAEKSGLDRAAVAKMLTETLFTGPVNKNYGAMIADLKPRPAGFRLMLGLKDVELALGAADVAKAPMPFASLLRDRFLSAAAKGRGDLDWSAIALGVAEDAGINVA